MTAPGARVLIHEIVLDYHPSEAPSPLLPNYGSGALLTYGMDLHMMASLNSRERTLGEFIALCAQAELKYLKIWDGGALKMIEFQTT